jgi:hypothetical protein
MTEPADTELMKKALKGSLGPDEKESIDAKLSLPVTMPAPQDGAETGTLQPLTPGLGWAHRPVLY